MLQVSLEGEEEVVTHHLALRLIVPDSLSLPVLYKLKRKRVVKTNTFSSKISILNINILKIQGTSAEQFKLFNDAFNL